MVDLHSLQFAELVRLLTAGSRTFLLVGDNGVGKKTLVRRVLAAHFPAYELLEYPKFAIDEARNLKATCLRKAAHVRAYLIDGDHTTVQAYNAILKLLEEPLPDIVFLICAAKPPLATIVSRCNNILVPPLTVAELKQVLQFSLGMSERATASVIPFAHGSISQALRVYEKFEEKRRLLPFIKALKDRDLAFVLGQVKTITYQDITLMAELADDVLLSRYGLLNQELSLVVPASPDFLLQVKAALLGGRSPSLCWLRAWFTIQ